MILLMTTDPTGVIGDTTKVPWDYPKDREFFNIATKNNVVIMGRKTWNDMSNKPLPNRVNVVVSETLPEVEGAHVIRNHIDINVIHKLCPDKHIYLIGGKQLFTEWIDLCTDMIVTHLKKTHKGDIVFHWNWMDWIPTKTDLYRDNDIRIVHYKRKTI